MLRWLIGLVLLILIAAGGAYVAAGRGAPPTLSIDKPDRTVGQKSDLQVTAGAPAGTLTRLNISLEQNGKTTSLFTLEAPQSATLEQVDATHVLITRPFGKQGVPELQQGTARIVVSATRKSLFNLRTLSASAAKEVQVRLEPPRVSIVSTHHYVNHGGSEMVIYRATPPDVPSGVRVGDVEYAGFPAAGAGVTGADPSMRVAFFALLHDQDLKTPINVFARDDAGNEARASFIDNVFEKPFKRSRIQVDDKFFGRVVPEIIEHSPELNMQPPTGDLLPGFLKVNGDLRRMNADRIIAVTANTSPTLFFKGPFVQLGNSQVEASFADHRTYLYNGKDVDQQVHLGFDLAVTARVPVHAANDGKVLNASWLGIFGNCVILDHGMGVASLYGHLSSLDVNVGDTVKKGQVLGRSGMTGMAGGDHLHFTMLVGGRPVNPVEWWDPHWIADRVERKIREASSAGSGAAAAAMP
jgi:murein DD-endopeptidase MepM/ murein hydrolase activator NlpD